MRPALAASVGAAAAALLAASVLLGDGSSDDRVTWIGTAAVLAGAAAVVAVLWGRLGVPGLTRAGWAFVALLTAFVAWNGFSVLWSIEPDRTWNYFNRGLVYVAFAIVGLFVGSYGRRVWPWVAGTLAAVSTVVVGWALLVKVVPRLDSDSGRIARLHVPLGYWNALALLLVMGVPALLWVAARREHVPWLRAAAVGVTYAALVALLFTYSRGGIAAAVVSLAVWIVLGRPRLESAVALAVAAAPAAAVAVWAFARPGLANDHQRYSARFHDGILFGIVVVLVGLVVGAAAWWLARADRRKPLPELKRAALGRLALFAVGALVLAGGAVLVAKGAGPSRLLHDFTQSASPQQASSAGRLATLSSTSRSTWWRETWHAFKAHPANGTGAGSFELTDRRLRPNHVRGVEPHSLPLQFLSETGIVGFLLALAAAVAAILAIAGRRFAGRDGAAGAALAVVPVAYGLHALVDFDWDFLSVTAPLFFVLGVLVSRDARAREDRIRPLWATGAAVLACAVVYSLLAPWLAARKIDDAYSALAGGSARAAIADAKDAHDLNPLALEPLFVWAAAEQVAGNDRQARRLYVEAVRLQPLNSRSWYELGRFETASGDGANGRRFLHRAAQLDPQGPAKGL